MLKCLFCRHLTGRFGSLYCIKCIGTFENIQNSNKNEGGVNKIGI